MTLFDLMIDISTILIICREFIALKIMKTLMKFDGWNRTICDVNPRRSLVNIKYSAKTDFFLVYLLVRAVHLIV